jgi:hypothetical protein
MFNIVDYFDIEDEGFHDIITKNIDKEEKDAIIEDNKGA